jgi:hypothetical protein
MVGTRHGRKSRGGGDGGTNPPRICSGGTLIQVVPPEFCLCSKFQALAMDSSPPQISTQVYTPLVPGSGRLMKARPLS